MVQESLKFNVPYHKFKNTSETLSPNQIIGMCRTRCLAFVNMHNLQFIFDLFNTVEMILSRSDVVRYEAIAVQNMGKTVRHTV